MATKKRIPGRFYDAGAHVFNVMHPDYGAAGDGTTVEDAAIQRCLDDIVTNGGGIMVFPAGYTYLIDNVNLGSYNVPIEVWAWGASFQKATATVGHMFYDTNGTGQLKWYGGSVDLRRASFSNGNTVSFFFGVRCDDLHFEGIHIYDGIEEGIKLYKPRRAQFIDLYVDNVRNNGIQCHVPATGTDGYTGAGGEQGIEDILIQGCRFEDVDDGNDGTADGEGVTFNSLDATQYCRNVRIIGNKFLRCIRGIWIETDTAGSEMQDCTIEGNVVIDPEFHGIGIVAAKGVTCVGNVIRNAGQTTVNPPSTSSESFGIIVSGTGAAPSQDVVVSDNTIVDDRGGSAMMQYGVRMLNCSDVTVRNNRIRGATIKDIWQDSGGSADNVEIIPTPWPACRVYKSATQSINDSTWVTQDWGSETFKTHPDLHDTGANTDRLVAAHGGVYKVRAQARWGFDADGYRGIRIYRNNGSDELVAEVLAEAVEVTEDTTLQCEGVAECDADDYFFVQFIQATGGAVSPSTNESGTWASIELVGGRA